MPSPGNKARRQKFTKAEFQVKNWSEYDRALQERGSLTVWFTLETVAAWHSLPTGKRGRSHRYSDVAIDTGQMLRLAFGRPWQQTEGLLRSIATLLGAWIESPDHTTFSWRSAGLSLATEWKQTAEPTHVVTDSTGLKAYGAGEWQVEKQGGRDRHSWRKLPLAINADNDEILASELTTKDKGDLSMAGHLLEQIQSPLASVKVDGVYMMGAGLSRHCRTSAAPTADRPHPAAGDRCAELCY